MFGCGQDRRQDSDKADEWDVLRLGGLVLLTKLISDSNLITRVGSHLALQQDDKVKDLLHLLKLAVEESLPANQQMAFLALRQLSRKTKDPKILTQALKKLDVKFLHSIKNPGVLGASILTITDILMTAEVQGVEYLSS